MTDTRTLSRRLGAALLLAAAWTACSVDRFPLPSGGQGDTFTAGDTTWLKLNSFIELGDSARAEDLFINDDGHVYVAESHSGRVRVFDQTLAEVGEAGLEDFVLPGVRGVCVGPEQLLCAVAGDSALWSLNLAARRETLVWGLSGAVIQHRQTQAVDTVGVPEIAALIESGQLGAWIFLSVDSLDLGSEEMAARFAPRVLWRGNSAATKFVDVARGRAGKREIFLANANGAGNRINRLRLEPDALLFTASPDVPVVLLYRVASSEVITSAGTGIGTVDGIRSLDADAAGALYLTQTAPTVGAWKVQRLEPEEFAGIDYWSFDQGLLGRSIMEPERFEDAVNAAYTASNIFVVDRREDGHRVQTFSLSGRVGTPLGATRTIEYDTLWVEDEPQLQLVKGWRYDLLGDPTAVAVYGNRSDRAGNDDEIVFVADSTKIKLFMLSVSSRDLPVQ